MYVDLQDKIREIQTRLAVNVSDLSSTIRKLTSAQDNRPSSVSIGAFGVGIIISMVALLVFIDSSVLLKDLTMLYRNLRHGLCPQKTKPVG